MANKNKHKNVFNPWVSPGSSEIDATHNYAYEVSDRRYNPVICFNNNNNNTGIYIALLK